MAPADEPNLPVGDLTDEQIVAHVDMDCFYAACERVREPELVGEPVVVGMGFEPGETRGAVATASYEARKYGVESAMGIGDALDRLPRRLDAGQTTDSNVDESGYYRPVDMEFYRSVSETVQSVLREHAAVVRTVSIDEAYLDITDRTTWATVKSFASKLRAEIEVEAGVKASVGITPNMSTAKIASDHDKPDGLVVVEPDAVESFLSPLPVEELHGVGPVTARTLRGLDVETAGDLARTDLLAIEKEFGQRGRELVLRARGIDERAVEPRGRPKSLSRESSLPEATDDVETKRDRVQALADAVAERADAKGATYRTIGIKVVTPPYDVHTREQSLPGPVADAELVDAIALELLEEFSGDAVRKVGVRVSNLSFEGGEQGRLDHWDDAPERDNPPPTRSRGQARLGEFFE